MEFNNDELLFILDATVRRLVELRDVEKAINETGENIRKMIFDHFTDKYGKIVVREVEVK